MNRLALLLGLSFCGPATADTTFLLSSTSERVSYGVLVVAPDKGCAAARVTVRAGGGGHWRSATLGPGEIAVVRLGRGFAVGQHALQVGTAGCQGAAFPARRVLLGQASPGHGWRGQ